MLKISILLPDMSDGGAERVSLDLAGVFTELGHNVEFVVMSATGDFLNEAKRNFSVFDLCVRQTRNLPIPLARYLRKRRPDALIANMWPLTSAAVVGRVLSGVRCSLLLVEHTTLTPGYATWGRLHNLLMQLSITVTYRWADQIAAVSLGSAVDTARLAHLSNDRVKVLYNPIPMRPWPGVQALGDVDYLWGCRKGARILTVGSLKSAKNYPLLLKAFALLDKSDARLMFLGQGDEEISLRNLANEFGIGGRVIFAGFHSDTSAFYASADLFVMSSDYEGFGNVIVEALSFGLPVVSTDCPSGPSEILENGRWGKLVPVGDADALSTAMHDALNDPVDHASLKKRAADFSPNIAGRTYLNLMGFT